MSGREGRRDGEETKGGSRRKGGERRREQEGWWDLIILANNASVRNTTARTACDAGVSRGEW